jgi:hypothetical protein
MGAVYGTYLYTLESELAAGEELVRQAILFEGLSQGRSAWEKPTYSTTAGSRRSFASMKKTST